MSRPQLLFVRAIWGDDEVSTWQKTKDDVRRWAAGPRIANFPEVFFAFGRRNAELLEPHGVDVALASEEHVENFSGKPNRRTELDNGFGQVNYGVSMWMHKLATIRQAFRIYRPRAIVWLDVDTRMLRQPDERMLKMLSRGPAFQGRLKRHKNPQCPWRGTRDEMKMSYHGGCYYIRDAAIVREAIKVQRRYPARNDETAISGAIDNLFLAACG
jgi:hypothetical protein